MGTLGCRSLGLLGIVFWGLNLWAQGQRVPSGADFNLSRFDRVQQYHSQLETGGSLEELQHSEQLYQQVRQSLESFLIRPTRETWMMYRVQLEGDADDVTGPMTPAYEAYFLSGVSQFVNRRLLTAEARRDFLNRVAEAMDFRDPLDRQHLFRLINPLRGEANVLSEVQQYGEASRWKLFMPLHPTVNLVIDRSGTEDTGGIANDFSGLKIEQDHGRFYRVDKPGLESVGWQSDQLRQKHTLDDFLESSDYHQRTLSLMMQRHLQQTDPEGSYFITVFPELEDAIEIAMFDETGKQRKIPRVITEVSLPITEIILNFQSTGEQKKQYLVKDEIEPESIVQVWTEQEVLAKHRELLQEQGVDLVSSSSSGGVSAPSASGRQAVEQLFSQLETTQDKQQVRVIFHKISEQVETQADLTEPEKEEVLFRQLEMLTLPKFEVVRNELAEAPSSLFSTSTYFGLPLVIKHMAQVAFNSSGSTKSRKILQHTDEYLLSHVLYVADSTLKDVTKKGAMRSYEAFKKHVLKNFITANAYQRIFGMSENTQVASVKNYKVTAGMIKLQAILIATLIYSQWWRTGKIDVRVVALSWLSILVPQALIHLGAYVIWVKVLHRTWQLKTFTGVGALLTVLEIGLTAYFADEINRFFHHTAHKFSSVKDLKKKWAELDQKSQDEAIPAEEVASYYTDEVAPAFQSYRNFLLYDVYEANRVYMEEFEQMRRIHDKLYAASLERQRRHHRFIQAKSRLVMLSRIYGHQEVRASRVSSLVQQRFERDVAALFTPFTTEAGGGPFPGVIVPQTPEEIYSDAKYALFKIDQQIAELLAHPEWKAAYESKVAGFHDGMMQDLEKVMASLREGAQQNFTSRAFLDFRRTGSKEDFNSYRRMKSQASEYPEMIHGTPVSNLIQEISILERLTRTLQQQPSHSERHQELTRFFQEETVVLRIELAQLMEFLESPLTIDLDSETEAQLEQEFNLQNDVLPDLTQWQTDYAPRSELFDATALPL